MEYATRVRAIRLYAFDGPAWCSLWEQLLLAIGGAPILPRLASVAFCNVWTRQALCPEALALVSPSVRKLYFNVRSPREPLSATDEKTGTLLSRIFEAAPEIEQLRLEALPFPGWLKAPSFRARCSRLRHLEVDPPIHPLDFAVLTELPMLRYLSLSLSRVHAEPSSPTTPPLLTLRSVMTLVIKGPLMGLNWALCAMHLPSMHSLVLEGQGCYGDPVANLAERATECFHAIHRHTSITSLSISVTYTPLESRGFYTCALPAVEDIFEASLLDIIYPLLSLSALRDVSLSFLNDFILISTLSDLGTIAQSWPALEAFHLSISLQHD